LPLRVSPLCCLRNYGTADLSSTSVDKSYPVHGGIFREEAIMLLRKFYVQENDKAPEPKQKKTRELKTEILPMDIHAPKS
jgi:tRNA-specific adenosine deaminase 2